MTISIVQVSPDSADAAELIGELDDILNPLYSAGHRHGYSVQKLIDQGVAFFVLTVDGHAAGCGGVQVFGSEYAELKRMYIRPQFQGQGLGKALLRELHNYAAEQSLPLLRLETGIYQVEAIGLYERYGFRKIPPFGDYPESETSIHYELSIL